MKIRFRVLTAVLMLLIITSILFVIVCEVDSCTRLKGYRHGPATEGKRAVEEGPYYLLGAVHVARGDTVTVDIANRDHKAAYFMVYEYNIDEKVPPHKAAHFEFTADKKGEFWFGGREKGEEGKLVVE